MSANSCRAYLSVQPTQGSMVRIIMGTLARSTPCSACVRPARFCDVGVRTRKRSRFLCRYRAHSIRLAARLLNHNLAACAVGRRKLGAPADPVVRNLAHKLLNDVHGLRDLGTAHLAAGIAIAIGWRQHGSKRSQVRIGTVAKHAHVVVHARGAPKRADHRQIHPARPSC